MKCPVITLDNKKVGDRTLAEGVFGLPVRLDLLNRVVNWQRAKLRAGTHMTRLIQEVSGTTKKPWRQKGTGRARQGSLRGPHFKGGAVAHGPRPRSHAYKLPKKVRKLAMRTALSSKATEGNLIILKELSIKSRKTKDVSSMLEKMGCQEALFVGGSSVDDNFRDAISNLHGVDVLPQVGLNVLDILKHKTLVLTEDAVQQLEERLV